MRTGKYRIIYEIDDPARSATVCQVSHWLDAYHSRRALSVIDNVAESVLEGWRTMFELEK